jgi:hypothetical protein
VRAQRPRRPGLVAVELARAPGRHDPVRPLDLDERHVAPAEAVARRVDAKAGAGSPARGLDPRQPPFLEEVVGELGVVRDVRQVVEDLLARAVDHDVGGDRVHRRAQG